MEQKTNTDACPNLGHENNGDNNIGRGQEGLYIVGLAELPAGAMVDSQALAEVLTVSTRTLRRMVGRGEIPRGIRLGGRSLWVAGKLVEYFNSEAERQATEARRVAKDVSIGRW